MNTSGQINELAAALAKAQSEMRPAKMGSVNPFLKNKYADLGEVIEASRPALTKNGLSVVQSVSNEGLTVRVTTMLMHASGQFIQDSIEIAVDAGKGMSVAQSIGAVITYLRRYSLAAMTGIYADDDTDGNEAKPGNGKPAQPAATKHEPDAIDKFMAETGAVVTASMTLETAAEFRTKKGTRFGDMTPDQLAELSGWIGKALAKPDQEPEYITDLKAQQAAIGVILASRNGGAK